MWSVVKLEKGRKPLSALVDVEKNFNFRPHAYTLRGVTLNLFFAASSEEISLVPRGDVLIGTYFLLAVMALHSSLRDWAVARA